MEKEQMKRLPEEYGFNLSDFALFLSVMKVKEAYCNTLSIVLDEEDLELVDVKVEQVVLNKSGRRAIRLDAWALDNKNRQINTEMQNDIHGDDVRKRARYYQSLLDTPILKSGKKTKYKQLPATIIIFITQEDIFGEDVRMNIYELGIQKGEELGKEEGKIEGKRDSILELLAELGDISKGLKQRILKEKDEELLKQWLKLAAKSESISDFMDKM